MELSLTDISNYLGVTANTIQRWVRQGKLPVKRKGANYIFAQKEIEKWSKKHNISLYPNKTGSEKEAVLLPTLSQTIENGGIYYDIEADSIQTALGFSLDNMENIPSRLKNELFNKLFERENVSSTGLGNGIAIPHPREQQEQLDQSMTAVCFLKNPIEYNALDKKPVSVLFILLCKSLEIHLHILSTLSFCLRDAEFSTFIKSAPDPDSILERIKNFQNAMS